MMSKIAKILFGIETAVAWSAMRKRMDCMCLKNSLISQYFLLCFQIVFLFWLFFL